MFQGYRLRVAVQMHCVILQLSALPLVRAGQCDAARLTEMLDGFRQHEQPVYASK